VIIARTRAELAAGLSHLRADGGAVALVPTMGFLHEGHLSLVDLAGELADHVAVSIFVNPLQFGPSEDFAEYPRDEVRDLALLEERGAELVFIPEIEEMYPSGDPLVTVDPGPLGRRLCGAYRPGHFGGVLIVVAKLFGLLRPRTAVFGRKDFQQAVLIRRMAQDLDLGVDVVTGPIVREADGLALSSRNSYLSAEERAQAPAIQRGMKAAAERFEGGERSVERLLEVVRSHVEAEDLLRLQYVELVDAADLEPVGTARDGAVLAVAAFCGETRLIDNLSLGEGRA